MNCSKVILLLIAFAAICSATSGADQSELLSAAIQTLLTNNPTVDDKIISFIIERQLEYENWYQECMVKADASYEQCQVDEKIKKEESEKYRAEQEKYYMEHPEIQRWTPGQMGYTQTCKDWYERIYTPCTAGREGRLQSLRDYFDSYYKKITEIESEKERCISECSINFKQCIKQSTSNCYGEFQSCNDPCAVQYSQSIFKLNKDNNLLSMSM